VDWWNSQVVVQEKVVEEARLEKDIDVNNNPELSVAVPSLPFPERLLSFSSKIVILDQPNLLLNPESNDDSWNV